MNEFLMKMDESDEHGHRFFSSFKKIREKEENREIIFNRIVCLCDPLNCFLFFILFLFSPKQN